MNELKIELWDIGRILPYERNVKKHPKEQVAKLAENIKRFGWDQPIVVDAEGVIIKGHGRRLAALELKLPKVPVLVRSDLTPEQVKAARLTDNQVALSGIDTEMLREELNLMGSTSDLLRGIFDDKELEFALSDLGSMSTDSLVPDLDAAVREQEGEARERSEQISTRRVSLVKAFGFSDIPGGEELVVTRFMAKAAAETGLAGADAVIGYMRQLLAA